MRIDRDCATLYVCLDVYNSILDGCSRRMGVVVEEQILKGYL